MVYCNASVVTGNLVKKSNGIAILMDTCFQNTAYNNTFIDNGIHQAFDNRDNSWDNGSWGNYWSDYTGKDENGDGIGDTPRPIYTDAPRWGPAADRYPLMKGYDMEVPEMVGLAEAVAWSLLLRWLMRRMLGASPATVRQSWDFRSSRSQELIHG